EEEELREAAGLHERAAVPAAEPEPARDPASGRVAAADAAVLVVEAAAVAVDEAPRGVGDELPQGRDSILERHLASVSSHRSVLPRVFPIMSASLSLTGRVDAQAWDDLGAQLDARGYAETATLLSEEECRELSDLFDGGRFRSTIDMARYRFGDGRYRYFDH